MIFFKRQGNRTASSCPGQGVHYLELEAFYGRENMESVHILTVGVRPDANSGVRRSVAVLESSQHPSRTTAELPYLPDY